MSTLTGYKEKVEFKFSVETISPVMRPLPQGPRTTLRQQPDSLPGVRADGPRPPFRPLPPLFPDIDGK